jgi:hypothetical protein
MVLGSLKKIISISCHLISMYNSWRRVRKDERAEQQRKLPSVSVIWISMSMLPNAISCF